MLNCSLIIVTKDRSKDMAQCLETVAAQSQSWSQVIIVDGGVDALSQVASSIQEQLPIEYHSSEPGITRQRNLGRSKLKPGTDIVVFIDDDVRLTETVVEQVSAFFEHQTNAIGLTGDITGEPHFSVLKKMIGRLTLTVAAKPYGYTAGLFNTISHAPSTQSVQWLPGAFMAYRHQATENIEFDEWFTEYGLGEDFEYSYRVSKIGKLYVDPSIVVKHDHSTVGRDWKRFGMMRVVNRNYLRKKHFKKSIKYWLGYWCATEWLFWGNMVRALWNKRYRQEWLGYWIGLARLLQK